MLYSKKISISVVQSFFKIIAITMLIVVVVILNACSKKKSEQPLENSETLRFVFLADSRGDSLTNAVNLPVLNAIISEIGALSPKPTFVIFGGDMSYRGYIKPSYTFLAWKELFAPLTHSGIKLYTAIGNHELYHQHSSYGLLLINQQEYQNVFSENPTNGPAGYDHLAYSFTSQGGNSFFAVLDPYYINQDTVHEGLGGNIDATQMAWLKAQVAQTTATHKFLIIHTPYYYIYNDTAEPSASNQTYTELWSFLDANKFDIYACGHSHLFSRRTIDGSVPPNPQTNPLTPSWKNPVVQLLNGTCGAIVSSDTIDPIIKSEWNVRNDPNTYYYSVIDISGSKVTVKSYSGNTGAYSLFDTFTVQK
ncbi:MAG: metallophosphoesterase [Bacteroidota bacterium]